MLPLTYIFWSADQGNQKFEKSSRKSSQNSRQAKYAIRAQFESLKKHLHQNTFETLKYLQQTNHV
jgi:hypothetical protein